MEALNNTLLFAAGTAVGCVGTAVAVYFTKHLAIPKSTTRESMTLDELFLYCNLVDNSENETKKRKASLQQNTHAKKNSITNVVQPTKVYLIRICGGGHFGAQSFSLTAALRLFQKKSLGLTVKIETMHPEDRRKFGNITEIINWLLTSDFHIISTHLHQGHFKKTPHSDWDIRILMKELSRLSDHPGFPTGCNLECPVFLQDKMKYLEAVESRTLETLKVPLSALRVGRFCPGAIKNENEVREFMTTCDERKGWIIKMGFMTNSGGRLFCKRRGDVIRLLRLTSERYGAWFPYAMVQPTLLNRMEYKVVVLDGKARYITMEKKKGGRAFATEEEVMRFAEESVAHLLSACPASLGRFLLRVDIMQRGDGRMIVNEFESLEAFFTGGAVDESNTTTWLTQFWLNVLEQGFK